MVKYVRLSGSHPSCPRRAGLREWVAVTVPDRLSWLGLVAEAAITPPAHRFLTGATGARAI